MIDEDDIPESVRRGVEKFMRRDEPPLKYPTVETRHRRVPRPVEDARSWWQRQKAKREAGTE